MNTEQILRKSLELNKEYNIMRKDSLFNSDLFRETMKDKYNDLYNQYQSIFNIATGDSFDYSRLSSMLNYAEKVRTGKMTEHNASVAVGQILVDQIVKPQISKKP